MNRTRRACLAGVLALLALIATSIGLPLFAQGQTIGGYVKVSEVRITRDVSEFTYRAVLTNTGPALSGATAVASSLAPKTTIVDGSLTFGPVGAGGTVLSSDTFSFRQDRTVAFSFSSLQWAVSSTPANQPPVANAGPDQTIAQSGLTVHLDGTASSDPDGDPLTYQWTLTSVPVGSTAVLTNPTGVHPSFVPDKPGDYIARLIVNDGIASSAADTVTITVNNPVPVANAGPDQPNVHIGATVHLDGSASSDPNNNPLTYLWSLTSVPVGSTAVLTNPTGVNPSFVPDKTGAYVARLVVNNGFASSVPDTVTITVGNTPPVANAGPDQTPQPGAVVTLNGSASSDADGDPLTFAWTLTSKPIGSSATLSNPTAVNPTFTVDLPGTYIARLIVNDGIANSAPDTVVINTQNSAPVANAGPDQTVFISQTATLDGSASSDVDGNPLTFSWSFVSRPAGSAATLSSPTAVKPTFVVDRPGTYHLRLTVNDGFVDSAPDFVDITTLNTAPVANAGPDQSTFVGNTVTLDGSASTDVDGDPLTYSWSLSSVPIGSAAALSNPTAVMPTFVADKPGTYVAQLVVNDGMTPSAADTVSITTQNSAPVANAGPDQSVVAGQLVLLDGSASSDVDGNALTFQWSFTSSPIGSTATLTNPTSIGPSFIADRPGTYVVQLIVNDGALNSLPDTVTLTTTNSAPVANAGPDQLNAPVGSLVTLDGTASSDADGHPLTYHWSLLSQPTGSTATLSGATTVNPTFTPDVFGQYVAQLVVNDGFIDSAPDTVVIQTANRDPHANAGPDQSVSTGATVHLDGSGSSDPDGQTITYLWAFASRPAGSTAILTGAGTVNPTFVADLDGAYIVDLTVTDSLGASATDSVIITSSTHNAATTLAVTTSGSPSVFGQPMTFTAIVSVTPPGTGTPTGTVAFLDGAASIGCDLQAVVANVATCVTSALSVGLHTINATYGGDASFLSSSNSVSQTVNKAATTLAVATNGSPSVTGQPVTFTATIAVTPPGAGTPTGTVTFLDGAAAIGCSSQAVVANVATCVTSALSVGGSPHTINATYSGDASFLTSSNSVSQTVNKAATTLALATSGSPTVSGQPVTFTATIAVTAPGAGTPTGTVAFLDGATPIGCAAQAVAGNVATCVTSALSVGGSPHTINATYTGDANFLTSSNSVSQTVNKAATTLAVTTSGSPSVFGQPVTFTATLAVTAPGAGTPTGTVAFLDGATPIGCAAQVVAANIATCVTSALTAAGSPHTINATYSGDASFLGSSNAVSQVVNDTTPIVTIAATDANASEVGPDPGTFRFTRVGDTTAALTVTYTIGGTATNGTDYTLIASPISFPAGQATVDLTITPINDPLVEGPETVLLTLVDGAAYDLGAQTAATVTIADQPIPIVTATAPDPDASEVGLDPALGRLTRVGDTTFPLTVHYTVGGTATGNVDYVGAPGLSLTIPAGQATLDQVITPIADDLVEGPETVIVTLVADAQYALGAQTTATFTIADQPVPIVTITAPDPDASEVGLDPALGRLTRVGDTTFPLTVTYTVGGTATGGVDYVGAAGLSLTIPAGQATLDQAITPISDDLVEGPETVIVTLVDGAKYDLGAQTTATFTIADQPTPIVTVTAPDPDASEVGLDPGMFRFTRVGNTTFALTVSFTVGGTASAGIDYVNNLGVSVTIPVGQTTLDVPVTPFNDATIEGPETAIVTLIDGAKYDLGAATTATVTIADNPTPIVTVTALDPNASEVGPDTGTFRFTRVGDTTLGLTVTYTVGGTATSGTDYTAIASPISFPAGQATVDLTITPITDATPEGPENVVVTLTDGVGYDLGAQTTATVTIADSSPVVTVVATDALAAEDGPDTGTFTFTRTGSTAAPLTVNFTQGGTATPGVDYTNFPLSVTIPATQASATVTVTPLADALTEPAETVVLTLAAGLYNIGPSNAVVTIDDSTVPLVTVDAIDPAASEAGPDPGVFRFTRTGSTAAALTVSYNLSGTATAGGDYSNSGNILAGNVVFAAGESTVDRTVPPINDALVEGPETVIVTLLNGVGYNLGASTTATVTIADQPIPIVTVAALDPDASEVGPDPGTFRFTRVGDTTFPLLLTFTVGGTAANNTDYANIFGASLVFAAGNATTDLTVTPINDAFVEGPETVILTLTDGAQYDLGASTTATVTIADQPTPIVTVTALDPDASEVGLDPGTFRFTRVGDTTFALFVTFSVGGTATGGSDYGGIVPSTTIPAGQATVDRTVTPIGDGAVEGPETVIVTLTDGAAYDLGASTTATVTIADQVIPTVTIAALDPDASEVGLDPGTFRFTRVGGDTSLALNVTYTIGGTAIAGSDYGAIAASIPFPAGQTTVDRTVTPINDATVEGPETIVLTLTDGAQYDLGASTTATVTIADQPIPIVTMTTLDPDASEAGLDPGAFRFTRVGDTSFALTVAYTIGGTAAAGSDYGAIAANISFPAGQTTVDRTVTPINDAVVESPETVILTLTDGAQYDLGASITGTVTIADQPIPIVTMTTLDPDASEVGLDPGTFRFTRVGDTSFALTVAYTIGGTAIAGTDYGAIAASISFPAGQTTVDRTVTPINDAVVESPETVILTLTDGAQYDLGASTTGTVTIADQPIPIVTMTTLDPDASEVGLDPGTFRFTRVGDTSFALTVTYTIGGTATPGSDYGAIAANISFPAGQTTVDRTVTPINDATVEGPETVIVTLTDGAQYDLGVGITGTITIADQPIPIVTMTTLDPDASEIGLDPGTFRFTRVGDTSFALTVTYTIGGTAVAGSDYQAIAANISFPAGQTTVDRTVTPINDATVEGPETVILTLVDGAQYDLGASITGTVTIADQPIPIVTVTAFDPDASETGLDPGTFRFTRVGDTDFALTATYTIGGTAVAGSDYQAIAANVTFAAGATTADRTVTPVADALVEGPETVIVTLTDGANYDLGASTTATVTIVDSSPVVTVAATNATVTEGGTSGVFTFTRTGSTASATTVNWTRGGTAALNTDYTLDTNGSVTIPAGSATATVTVTALADTVTDDGETVTVTITAGGTPPYFIGTAGAVTMTIADTPAPTITLVATDATVTEGGAAGTFTFTRTGPTGSAAQVFFAFGGTAGFGGDYTTSTAGLQNVIIPAGSATATVTITALTDAVADPGETVTLTLGAGNNPPYIIGTVGAVTMTILDTPAPVITLVATDPTVTEGGAPGTFTFTRTGSTATATTVSFTFGGTAGFGSDYTTSTGGLQSVVIPAGSATATVTITALPDAVADPGETVTLTLLGGGGTPPHTVGTVGAVPMTILDTPPPVVTVVATDATVAEGAAGVFTFTRTGPTTSATTVNWTRGGTATFGPDYNLSSNGFVTIPAGSATATVSVTALTDAVVDDGETVTVTLIAGGTPPYGIGTAGAVTMTIVDTTVPVVTIAAVDASEVGPTAGSFTITRTNTALALPVSFTRGGTATQNVDYSLFNGGQLQTTIPAGQATVTLPLTPMTDGVIEGPETVVLALTAGAGYTLGVPAAATLTIADDPVPQVVTVTAVDASEVGPTAGSFTITRTNTALALPVSFTRGGTATQNVDYSLFNGGQLQTTIPAGQASMTLPLTPLADGVIEGPETVVLTLTAGAGYTLGAPAVATLTIADDPVPQVVTVTAVDASEVGPTAGSFTITRTNTALALPVTFTRGGTATQNVDYSLFNGGQLQTTIPAGQASVTLPLTPLTDGVSEGPETVVLTLTAGAGYVLGVPVAATLTITDSTPQVTVAALDASASEVGLDPGTFRFTRVGDIAAALTVSYLVGGTATSAVDYSSIGTTVTFAAGQATVDMTVTPLNDALVEGPETVIVTLTAGAGYTLGVPATATVTIADNVLQSMTLTLVGTQVVGVGRTAALQVTLGQPAPAGGLTVTVTSDNVGLLTVAAPGTTTIAAGASTGQVTLNGVAFGDTIVRGTATGYAEATLGVSVTLNLLSAPATLGVGLGQTTSLPITIGPSAAPPGGVVVDVVSANPAIIEVVTPQVTVLAGALSVNATVRGAGIGTASVSASSAGYATTSTAVTSTGELNIIESSVSFNNGFTAPTLTVRLESSGNPVAAPSNLAVTLVPTNAACVTVPASVTILAGQVSATFQPAYGGSAALPCTTNVTASVSGLVPDSVSVTVDPQPGITMPATQTVGAWLQVLANATLGVAQHGGVTVTVSSSDPTRVLVSPNATTAGAASFTLGMANGNGNVAYVVQGVEGTTGSAIVTVSAPGFLPGASTVNVVPIGVEVYGLPVSTTTLSPNDIGVYAQIGLPNAGNSQLNTVQNVRAGGPAFVVTLTNSNATVAQLISDEPATTGQTVTKPILPGIYYNQVVAGGTTQYGFAFDPLAAGTTTVTVTGPAGVTTMSTTGVRTITVTAPGLTMPGTLTVGAWLQFATSATLGASQHGGVTVTVSSSDPTRVKVSPNATTAGAVSFTQFVANGSTNVPYYVQGMEGTTGSAIVTVSAPGFPNGTHEVDVVPIGVEVYGLPASTTTLSPNDIGVYAQIGLPNAGNTQLNTVQNIRAGAPAFVVTLTNSNATVAQLISDEPATTGQTVTKPILPGIYYNQPVPGGTTSYGFAFDPLAAGTTTVTVTGPAGVVTMSTTGVRSVTVTGPGLTVPGTVTVGAWLQAQTPGATLGASQHGGVIATVSSSDPTRVLVSPNATTPGTTSFTLSVPNGSTNVPYYVQGMEGTTGSAIVTVSAPGFPSGTHQVDVVPIGVELYGLPASTTTLSATEVGVYAQVGLPIAGNTQLAAVQNIRAGAPAFVVTLTNSNATVAQLISDEPATTGQTVTKPILPGIYYNQAIAAGTSYGLAFDPLGSGTTTVTVTGPPGVATMSTTGVRTVTVGAPAISTAAAITVGSGMQISAGATLGASQHGGVDVTISSSSPGLLLVAPDATTAGTGSIIVHLANGSTNVPYFVQGVENNGGTAVVTVSAPGFTNATTAVTVAPVAVEILQLDASMAAGAADDTDWYVQVGIPNAGNTGLTSAQNVRAGGPAFVVTLTNSNASVAQLRSDQPATTGQSVTKPIQTGIYYTQAIVGGTTYGLAFDPLAAGSTTVTVTGPAGVGTTTAGVRTITVTP